MASSIEPSGAAAAAELRPSTSGARDSHPGGGLRRAGAALRERWSPAHAALLAVIALAAVLDLHRLSQNGYANTYYSAGVRSQLRSLHNLLFMSADPGGLISLDKPPLAIWTQVASAKLFGFAPLSLLVPEALIAILTVAVLYRVVSRRFGAWAGVASALVLTVFPSFVAVARDNAPDPMLILFMLLACGAMLRAVESGSLAWLLGSAVLVGLAFNSKALAALLVVPGLALAYVLCAERSLLRRVVALLVAGLVVAVVSFSWIAFVDLTPKSQRPFIGDSTKNSELDLVFGYNGLGRVGGQVGGPGQHPHRNIGTTAAAPAPSVSPSAASTGSGGVQPIPSRGRARFPSAFGGPTGPLRLFSVSMGGQGGWILPFASFGLLAIALTVRGRRDPRLAALLALGGWSLVEAVVLSFSKGIVHPYYLSALAPGAAAMAGAGAAAMAELARPIDWRLVLPALGVAATLFVQYVLLRREHYLQSVVTVVIILATIGLAVMLIRPRRALPAMLGVLAMLAVAPAAYSTTVWGVPVQDIFPAAGPHAAGGSGGIGVSPVRQATSVAVLQYVRAHHPGRRWEVLTTASLTAAPLILLGADAAAVGGYDGTDAALDGPALARLVKLGEARYVWLGGAFSSRGGNLATDAVQHACRHIPAGQWRGQSVAAGSLYDCGGRERQLSTA